MTDGEVLWAPSEAVQARSRVAHYMAWLEQEQGRSFADYDALMA